MMDHPLVHFAARTFGHPLDPHYETRFRLLSVCCAIFFTHPLTRLRLLCHVISTGVSDRSGPYITLLAICICTEYKPFVTLIYCQCLRAARVVSQHSKLVGLD